MMFNPNEFEKIMRIAGSVVSELKKNEEFNKLKDSFNNVKEELSEKDLMTKTLKLFEDMEKKYHVNDKVKEVKISVEDIMENAMKAADELSKRWKEKESTEDTRTEQKEDEKIKLDFNNLVYAINNNVAPKIAVAHPEIDTILCVTRGGLVPSGIMAYALDIKNIINIKVQSYTNDNKQEDVALTPLSKKDVKRLGKSKGILIVDDILDTGHTVIEIYDYLNFIGGQGLVDKTELFTIVSKDYDEGEFCVYNLTGDKRWVDFPWTQNK